MINKLEAGKTYRLVDKEGYLVKASPLNHRIYRSYFKDDKVTLDFVTPTAGYIHGEDYSIINIGECKYFDLVGDYEYLQQIGTPFGELDKQTKKDLLCAWVDGADIEVSTMGEWVSIEKMFSRFIVNGDWKYRVKPTISAKAELISEAQQQLRDAQEALAKAQQL